jgi:hypothetical protein
MLQRDGKRDVVDQSSFVHQRCMAEHHGGSDRDPAMLRLTSLRARIRYDWTNEHT